MKLSFETPYLSITSFTSVEVPDFTLITGLNGSGKTHLLQALVRGDVLIDGTRAAPRFVDWSTIAQYGGTDGNEHAKSRIALESQVKELVGCLDMAFRDVDLRLKAEPQLHLPRSTLIALSAHDFSVALVGAIKSENGTGAGEDVYNAIRIAQTYFEQLKKEHVWPAAAVLAARLSKSVYDLQLSDMHSPAAIDYGSTQLFSLSFERLFIAYRDRRLANDLSLLRESLGEVSPRPGLSKDEFERIFLPPPWTILNSVLQKANLPFEVQAPDPTDRDVPYGFHLKKIAGGASVYPQQLSSGEKVMLALASAVYYGEDQRQTLDRPSVLLLDEIDATLHPAMSKDLVRVLSEVLVQEFGLKVIATTHSPSTVAFAPEGSVFVMQHEEPRLSPVSKSIAINTLTQGVPTLAIDFEGRRQVLVEAAADAAVYQVCFEALLPNLNTERSLNFIAAGGTTEKGDQGGGCANVKRLIEELRNGGNKSVFGLIDWDGKNTGSEELAVFAEGKRYALENFVLDPLMIAATICREFPNYRQRVGIDPKLTFAAFQRLPVEKLQSIVTRTARVILGSSGDREMSASYVGGFELVVDERCFKTPAKEWERLVLETFSFLRRVGNAGNDQKTYNVMKMIAITVIAEHPDFAPIELQDSFLDLLNR